MKRILVGYLDNSNNSGINKYLFNFIRQVKANYDVEIDLLSSDIGNVLLENLNGFNCKVFEIPSLKHPIRRYKAICKILDNNYDIVYSNISEAFNCCTLLAAKNKKVKKIIAHSHTSGSSKENPLNRIFRTLLNKLFKVVLHNSCTAFLACSVDAGNWLFFKKDVESKKFHVINNTIDFNNFYYNEKFRKSIRKKYGISDDNIVLGNIGNFEFQKNQMFIFQMLKRLLEKNKNYKFILIGKGRLKETFEDFVKKENLTNKVIFTGVIKNVNEVLNAMDIFVFPSMFEGFGIAALEAQISGLPTLVSDKVPSDILVSENVYQLPLDIEQWCDKVISLSGIKRSKVKLLKCAYKYDDSNIEQFKYIIEDEI